MMREAAVRWTEMGENQYDVAAMESVIRHTLKSDPQARRILRVRINAPASWFDRHPEHVSPYHDGTDPLQGDRSTKVKTPFLASTLWRRDVRNLLQSFGETRLWRIT